MLDSQCFSPLIGIINSDEGPKQGQERMTNFRNSRCSSDESVGSNLFRFW